MLVHTLRHLSNNFKVPLYLNAFLPISLSKMVEIYIRTSFGGYCCILLDSFLIDLINFQKNFKTIVISLALVYILWYSISNLKDPFLAVQHFSFASECCKNLCPSVLGLGRALI